MRHLGVGAGSASSIMQSTSVSARLSRSNSDCTAARDIISFFFWGCGGAKEKLMHLVPLVARLPLVQDVQRIVSAFVMPPAPPPPPPHWESEWARCYECHYRAPLLGFAPTETLAPTDLRIGTEPADFDFSCGFEASTCLFVDWHFYGQEEVWIFTLCKHCAERLLWTPPHTMRPAGYRSTAFVSKVPQRYRLCPENL